MGTPVLTVGRGRAAVEPLGTGPALPGCPGVTAHPENRGRDRASLQSSESGDLVAEHFTNVCV